MRPSDEKIRELTGKLEDGIHDLFESEQYAAYLKTVSKFHRYSFRNVLLIFFQNPDASAVAGFNAWKKDFGRTVKRGEKGIQIFAPCTYKTLELQAVLDPITQKPILNPDGTAKTAVVPVKRQSFKVAYVFDISQTEGPELPTIGVDELTGNVAGYIAIFNAICDMSPVPVQFREKAEESKGSFHRVDRCIYLNPGMSEVMTVKTGIHELAHAMLHDDPIDTDPKERKDQHTREVEAESTAYVVCQHFGIDTSDYSFGYVAGWSKGRELDELKASLDTISSTAKEIIDGIESRCPELFPTVEKSEQTEYRYYSTQRPVDIGTFPKPPGNEPIHFTNFDERRLVENGTMRAWGVLSYAHPLTDKQMYDYELRPAPDNPDVKARKQKKLRSYSSPTL